MTTDPKALIERADRDLKEGADLEPILLLMKLALRDLTAENERLTEQRDFLGAQAADLALKVGRLKSLGDGLAEALKRAGWDHINCAAFAAWETKDA